MDCSPPSFSAYGNILAIIREWVAFPPPGDLPNQGSNKGLLQLLQWQVDSLLLSLWEALGSLMAAR